jgi:hypothetical protein
MEGLFTIDIAANDTSVVFCLEWENRKLLFVGDGECRRREVDRRGDRAGLNFAPSRLCSLHYGGVRLPKRCVDLTEDHIDDGLKSIDSMRVLLEHMARIAKPNEGAAKILVAISRIATTACEWLEGTLHVQVDEVIGATEIEISSDLGGGMRELIFPRLFVGVPHEELVRAVKLAPKLVTPLKFRIRGDRMILKRDAPGTVAPPAFEIAEESLRRSLPPKLRRSLAPIPAPRKKEEPTVEGTILGRLFPKAQRTLVIDELAALDVGWDFGSYSTGVNTRETKPPPAAKTPSKLPTQAPPKPEPRRPGKRPVLRKVTKPKP